MEENKVIKPPFNPADNFGDKRNSNGFHKNPQNIASNQGVKKVTNKKLRYIAKNNNYDLKYIRDVIKDLMSGNYSELVEKAMDNQNTPAAIKLLCTMMIHANKNGKLENVLTMLAFAYDQDIDSILGKGISIENQQNIQVNIVTNSNEEAEKLKSNLTKILE